MAEKIKEKLDIEIALSSGKVGELSVYWNGERLSKKGDALESILEKLMVRMYPTK